MLPQNNEDKSRLMLFWDPTALHLYKWTKFLYSSTANHLIEHIGENEREKYLTEQGSIEKPDPEDCAKEQPVQLPIPINSSLPEDVTQFTKLFGK
jgi:hypothetical protein